MILTEALHSVHCADDISKNPNLPKLLGTNGPTGKQFLATSRNDCHHIVSEELEIPSAETVQVGYYDPHGSRGRRQQQKTDGTHLLAKRHSDIVSS